MGAFWSTKVMRGRAGGHPEGLARRGLSQGHNLTQGKPV